MGDCAVSQSSGANVCRAAPRGSAIGSSGLLGGMQQRGDSAMGRKQLRLVAPMYALQLLITLTATDTQVRVVRTWPGMGMSLHQVEQQGA